MENFRSGSVLVSDWSGANSAAYHPRTSETSSPSTAGCRNLLPLLARFAANLLVQASRICRRCQECAQKGEVHAHRMKLMAVAVVFWYQAGLAQVAPPTALARLSQIRGYFLRRRAVNISWNTRAWIDETIDNLGRLCSMVTDTTARHDCCILDAGTPNWSAKWQLKDANGSIARRSQEPCPA